MGMGSNPYDKIYKTYFGLNIYLPAVLMLAGQVLDPSKQAAVQHAINYSSYPV